MKFFFNTIKLLILSFLVVWANSLNAQCAKEVTTIYGKLIETDTISKLIDVRSIKDHGNNFYYGILHLKVETYQSDTIIAAIIYHLRTEMESLLKSFDLKIDSTYIFWVTSTTPCQSDFPSITGCMFSDTKLECLYFPQKGQIIQKPYSKISRIVETSVLYKDTWEKLYNKYRKQ